jgi:hypothetical protein
MNLFIVSSPFQLLNAFEAKYHYKSLSEDSILVILDFYGEKNMLQIKEVLNVFHWSNTVVHTIRATENKINFLFRLRKVVKKYKNCNYNRVFIGEYFAYEIRAIVNSIKYIKLVLFDDGNGSIKTINHLIGKKTENSPKIIRDFVYKLFGLDTKKYENISLFTAYDFLIDKNVESLTVEKNNYCNIKLINKDKKQVEDIIFLGVKFVEKDLIDFDTYKKLLSNAIKHLRERCLGKINYVPHRGENLSKLRILEDELDMQLLPLNETIELYLVKSEEKPRIVTTFFSSAVFSLQFIFGNDIVLKSFYLKFGERVPTSYHEYEKLGIEVVKNY